MILAAYQKSETADIVWIKDSLRFGFLIIRIPLEPKYEKEPLC